MELYQIIICVLWLMSRQRLNAHISCDSGYRISGGDTLIAYKFTRGLLFSSCIVLQPVKPCRHHPPHCDRPRTPRRYRVVPSSHAFISIPGVLVSALYCLGVMFVTVHRRLANLVSPCQISLPPQTPSFVGPGRLPRRLPVLLTTWHRRRCQFKATGKLLAQFLTFPPYGDS